LGNAKWWGGIIVIGGIAMIDPDVKIINAVKKKENETV